MGQSLHMPQPTAESDPQDRIAYALEGCMVEHGYAAAKLVDIAERVGMSPPHVRYYFRTKDDILAYSYERLLQRVQGLLEQLQAPDPRAWLEALGDLMLGGGRRGREALIVLNEANLVVARSSALRKLREDYDARVVARLALRLEQLTLAPGQTPANAASLLMHLLSGLMLSRALAGDDRELAVLRERYRQQLNLLLADTAS